MPDLTGWRRERTPRLPDTAWFELAPDWACEILAPSTAHLDRREKMPLYAAWGVAHLWLADPDLRTLEAYANQDGRWLLLATLSEADPVSLPPSTSSLSTCPGCGRIEGGAIAQPALSSEG